MKSNDVILMMMGVKPKNKEFLLNDFATWKGAICSLFPDINLSEERKEDISSFFSDLNSDGLSDQALEMICAILSHTYLALCDLDDGYDIHRQALSLLRNKCPDMDSYLKANLDNYGEIYPKHHSLYE